MPTRKKVESNAGGNALKDNIDKESAQQVAIDFLKKRKYTDKIDVSAVEKNNEIWIIRGTCPIDLEGHPWAEKFEIKLDTKGRVKSTNFALL
jgi:hypothetical protein